MSLALETEVLFELSLAIDASDGLQPMLRRFLSDMLRLLNGSGGAIVQLPPNQSGMGSGDDPVRCLLPRSLPRNPCFAAFSAEWSTERLYASLSQAEGGEGRAVLRPREGCLVHAFCLQDFGVLMLVRSQSVGALPEDFQRAFAPLVRKLAHAARACLFEAELRAQKQRLELASYGAEIGVWEWDIDRQRLRWDDRMLDLFGVARTAFRERFQDWADRVHPEDLPRAQRHFQAAIEHDALFDIEFRIIRPDQEVRHLRGRAAVSRTADGRPERVVGVNFDITTQKLAEEEMRQARDLAEQSSQFKSRFLANMSHEIRTPMNAVIGLCHLTLQTELTPRQRDYLENISTASQNLLAIINDILDFSKIEAGKMSLERGPFRLSEVIDSVIAVVRPRLAEKGLSLTLHVDRDVPDSWLGDPVRLGQVLINLAGNAVKFTERGGIGLSVSRVDADEPGGAARLEIAVSDTGIGMSPTQQAKLFQAFSQVDSSTTRRFGGTGLGLAISRQIIALMNGTIAVDSAPGLGSTFRIQVALEPLARPPADDPVPAALRGRAVRLQVSDNERRAALALILERLDLRVADNSSDNAPPLAVIADGAVRDRDGAPLIVLTPHTDGDEDGVIRLEPPPTEWRLRQTLLRLAGLLNDAGAAAPARGSLAGARVLLVEDTPLNQQVARDMLENAGIEVAIAGTGPDALAWLERETFDLVLMDVQMPGIDGLETTRRLRRRPELADLPVIAMTAHAMAADRDRCLDSGMNDHIAKPIHPPALFAALSRWLNKDVAAVPAAAPALSDPAQETEILHSLGKPVLDVLDVRQALRSVNGKVPLLRRLLNDFARDQGVQGLFLHQAVRDGRLEDAHHIAHTLKGTAATIGATELARAAASVETALARGEAPSEGHMDRLCRALSPLIQSILAMVPDPAEAPAMAPEDAAALPEPPADAPARRQALAALREALEAGDPGAEDLAETLVGHLSAAGPDVKAEAEALTAAAASFDFDDALAALDRLDAALHDPTTRPEALKNDTR